MEALKQHEPRAAWQQTDLGLEVPLLCESHRGVCVVGVRRRLRVASGVEREFGVSSRGRLLPSLLQTGAARISRAGSDAEAGPGSGGSGGSGSAWVLAIDSLLDLLRVLWLLRHRAQPLQEALEGAAAREQTSALQARLLAAPEAKAGSAPPSPLSCTEAELAHACTLATALGVPRLWAGERYCSHCSRERAGLAKCTRCQLAGYCGKDCQVTRSASGPCCELV